ncbi:hypothetical protein FALB51S_00428 [Frigidibacter albus]
MEQVKLRAPGTRLLKQTINLREHLIDPFSLLLNLLFLSFNAGFEKHPLSCDLLGNPCIALSQPRQFSTECHLPGVCAFGAEAGHSGEDFKQLTIDDLELCSQGCAIKAQEKLSAFHQLRVPYQNLLNHSAVRVLNDLPTAIDDDLALRDDRAGKLGEQGPPSKSKQKHPGRDSPE